MKNIHLIPTDRPSRLRIGDNGNFVFGMIQTSIQSKNDDFINQHIYITSDASDEEIKVGDWVITPTNDIIQWAIVSKPIGKKIILTTHQYLIKDGVQAIDDEFLEWFVKNPSCESVEIENKKVLVGWEPDYTYEDLGIDGSKNVYHNFYKIIIPQETLEEAVDRLAKKYGYDIEGGKVADFVDGVVRGAEWQSERIPSIIEEYLETAFISKEQGYMNPQKWFEQFKKK